ncbi:autotransporter outer membrane beta-barrel domain-containing protein [Chelatococcus sp. GCM10030263]|uniref:autotransporter outer membrane beta-barrel domain-containing protein n=1 Tax=Chelatococcus sp. GCM10030263 TaxID=3273387 RepID=UPI0036192A17
MLKQVSLGTSAIGLVLALTSKAAFAACSAAAPSFTCGPDGGNYPSGLDYQNDNPTVGNVPNLSLTITDGTTINNTLGQDGVSIEQSGNLSLTTEGVVAVTVGDPARADRDGLRLDSLNGNVIINSTADITVLNNEGDGIIGRSNTVDNEAPTWGDTTRARGAGTVTISSSGAILVTGNEATGITAGAAGNLVSITVTGNITTQGATASGAILAQNNRTTNTTSIVTEVTVTGADLSTLGAQSAGIAAAANRGGTSVSLAGGTITTQGYQSAGIGGASGLTNIYAIDASLIALTPTGGAVQITNGSADTIGAAVRTAGGWAFGISALSRGGAVDILNNGSVETAGDVAPGIAALSTYAPFFGTAKGGTITIDNLNSVSTAGGSSGGIAAIALSSDIAITSSGAVNTTGDSIPVPEFAALGVDVTSAGIQAVISQATSGAFTVGGNGNIVIATNGSGTISTSGVNAAGILAQAIRGSVTVDAQAAITTRGDESPGVAAWNTGAAAVTVAAGAITTGNRAAGTGREAHGIVAGLNPLDPLSQYTSGNVTVTAAGPIATEGDGASGIWAFASGNGTVTVTADAGITTLGEPATRRATGILAEADAGALTITAGDITTAGEAASAIEAASGDGPITVTTRAGTTLSTAKDHAFGINAGSMAGPVLVTVGGTIETRGAFADGVNAVSFGFGTSAPAAVALEAGSVIAVSGASSVGALAIGALGASIVAEGPTVTASGEFGAGLVAAARNASDATVTVGAGTTIAGGWQSDVAGTSPASGFSAAGILLGSDGGTASLLNNGVIGALSDRAVADLERLGVTSGAPATITNFGTITGFVELGSADDSFVNWSSNSFNLRHFADTDGDGVRDTERVAISDFGGGTNAFDNEATGTVRLVTVTGAATVDQTGAYVPANLNPAFHDMSQSGVEQAQILNLGTFRNAGVITMMDAETGGSGPVAGDVLVITGNAVAGGTPGTGVYIADGGQLRLDTVLNEGGANSQSDVLVVDTTVLGSAPTQLAIANAGGSGALTVGDGIEVVEVREKAPGASASGVFALGDRVVAGAYEYGLFLGGNAAAGGDPGDGNWYLRNIRVIEMPPVDPGPPPVDPGEVPTDPGPAPPAPARPPAVVVPNYRVEVPLYSALPALVQQFGFAMVGTLHERIGDDLPMAGSAMALAPASAAPRVIWCKNPEKNFRCTVQPEQNAFYAGAQPGSNAYRQYGVWGRAFGETGKRKEGSFWSGHGPSYSYDFGALQAGMDLFRREDKDGSRDHAGFFVSAGFAEGDVKHVFGGPAGTLSLEGYSLGLYWTHYGPTGWYLDAVVQGNWYADVTARSVLGQGLSSDGWGATASLEGGYPIALGNGFTLEPQAQIVYQRVSLDGGGDAFGLVSYDDTDSFLGRVGARLTHTATIEQGGKSRPLTTWLRANLWHGFGEVPRTTFRALDGLDPVAFSAGSAGTMAQIGLGATSQITDNAALFASGDYDFSVDGGASTGWAGRLGLKVVW